MAKSASVNELPSGFAKDAGTGSIETLVDSSADQSAINRALAALVDVVGGPADYQWA